MAVRSAFAWAVMNPASWGATSPDIYSITGTRKVAMERFVADWRHSGHAGLTISKVWQQAYRAGWRLVRVEIIPLMESVLRPITMQDVRLAVGEGPLKPADVLAGCNAELVRRKALISPAGEGGGLLGSFISFSPADATGNAVISPDDPADGCYWTLIGSGPDHDQNRLAVEIVARLNAAPRGMEG